MVDIVVSTSEILMSLEESLKDDTRTARMIIKRMGRVNTDVKLAQTGWVGLYADTVSFGPRTLGTGGRNWETSHTFRVVVQGVHRQDSALAHERLESYITDVLNVIFENKTLQATVDVLEGVNITYEFFREDEESLHYEGALIVLQFGGRTR